MLPYEIVYQAHNAANEQSVNRCFSASLDDLPGDKLARANVGQQSKQFSGN